MNSVVNLKRSLDFILGHRRIDLFLDNDKAGRKKFSMADRLVRAGCDVRIPVYPTKQPDQLDRQQILSAKEGAPVHVAAKKEENDAFR